MAELGFDQSHYRLESRGMGGVLQGVECGSASCVCEVELAWRTLEKVVAYDASHFRTEGLDSDYQGTKISMLA